MLSHGLCRNLTHYFSTTDSRRFDLKFYLPLALAYTAMLMALIPDRILYPAYFAEDGVVFFSDQFYVSGPQIWRPYNGYLHFYPRLAAWLISLAPVEYAPYGYVLAGVAAVWLFLLYCCDLRTYSRGIRVLLSASVVFSPLGTECLLNAVNSQWFLQFCPVLMLIRGHFRFYDLPVFALFALTGPFVIVLLPVLILDLWRRNLLTLKLCKSWGIVVIAVTAVVLQAGHVAGRISQPLHINAENPSFMIVAAKITIAVVTGFFLSIMLVHAWCNSSALIFLPVTGLLFLLAIGMVSRTSFLAYGKGISPRYFLLPFAMCLWYFILESPRSKWLHKPHRMATLAICLLTLVFSLMLKRYPDRNWSQMATCLKNPKSRQCSMKINPEGWTLTIDLPGSLH